MGAVWSGGEGVVRREGVWGMAVVRNVAARRPEFLPWGMGAHQSFLGRRAVGVSHRRCTRWPQGESASSPVPASRRLLLAHGPSSIFKACGAAPPDLPLWDSCFCCHVSFFLWSLASCEEPCGYIKSPRTLQILATVLCQERQHVHKFWALRPGHLRGNMSLSVAGTI